MPRITLYLKDAEIRSEVSGILTSGMAGVEVNLICDDSWDGLLKTLVCRTGDIAKSVLVKNDRGVVAHEALVEGKWLELGVEGRNEDGSVVIPTLWERCCIVMPGTDAQADPSADPTLPIWGQLQKRVEALEIPPVPVEIGALPRPMVAKIGQFFRVADVNQIGAVVAVEAVDMPSGGEYALPAATADTLGGVKAEPATENDTQPVRIGEDGMLFTAPGYGGGDAWELIADITFEEQVNSFSIDVDQKGNPFSLKKYLLAYVWEKITEGEQTSSYMYLIENNRQYGDNKPPLYTDAFEVAQLNSLVGGMIYNELLPNNIQWGQAWANNVQSSISVEPFRPIGSPMNNVMGKTVFKQHNDYLPFYQIGGKGAVMPKGSRVMLWGVRA